MNTFVQDHQTSLDIIPKIIIVENMENMFCLSGRFIRSGWLCQCLHSRNGKFVYSYIADFLMTINHKHYIEIMTIKKAKKRAEIKLKKLQGLLGEIRV